MTDTQKAIALIGETPVLEFRMLKQGADLSDIASSSINQLFEPAAITGKNLKSAELQFQGGAAGLSEPVVVLHFDSRGAKIFADLTKQNVGRYFGMFLDGVPISTPVIREAIPDGTAVISGNFTPEGAKELARTLNYGALPVPIELISTQTVSGTLGDEAVLDGIMAGLWGVGAVVLFMLFWYRLPGLLAAVALVLYIVVILAIFKLIPVTLTAAGIAAFILDRNGSDANVLIFERMKEELLGGKSSTDAIRDGFTRMAINSRQQYFVDDNRSHLFCSGTSLIKVCVSRLGVPVSMLTAISVSRTFLFSLGIDAKTGFARFLFGSGVKL